MIKNNTKIFIISFVCTILCFSISCSSNEMNIQKELFQFEQKLTSIIKSHDTVEFLNIFLEASDTNEEELSSLKDMSFVYAFKPEYIKRSIEKKTAIYGRIFSSNEKSIASFLPNDGNYDVDITMRSYKDNYIADIKYGTIDDYKEVYSIEFVLIYNKGEWKILTINFFEI